MAIQPLQLPSSQAFTPDITPSLANLVNTVNQGQERAFQRQTLADLGKGIADGTLSYDQAAGRLLAAGDRAGALSLAQLGMNKANQTYQHGRDATNDQFRREEAARAQGNADRAYGLQRRQFDYATTEKPTIEKVTNPDGSTGLVRVSPTGVSQPIDTGASQPTNPFAPAGKQTEGQANASLYASRMFNSEKILRDPSIVNAATSVVERGKAMLPGVGTIWNPNSEAFQKFDQAQRDFINATLRRESGAVISEEEFKNARKQYFPAPGDSQAVIKQKLQNRAAAIRGIAGAGGPSYRPPYTFDEGGALVENKAPRQSTRQPAQQFRDGQRARNASGQILEFRGGRWVPAQ